MRARGPGYFALQPRLYRSLTESCEVSCRTQKTQSTETLRRTFVSQFFVCPWPSQRAGRGWQVCCLFRVSGCESDWPLRQVSGRLLVRGVVQFTNKTACSLHDPRPTEAHSLRVLLAASRGGRSV